MPYKLSLVYIAIFLFLQGCGASFKDGDTSIGTGFKHQRKIHNHTPPQSPAQLGIDDFTIVDDTDNITQILYQTQKEWKKTPYVLGGTQKSGADCSGFIQTIFKEKFYKNIPRTTILQMRHGKAVDRANLQTGDLLFFYTGARPNGYHVGVYISHGHFLHLSSYGGARIQNLNMPYWKNKYIKARRY